MNIPMTAHFIGGCAIGDSPRTGVIDAYHRLYGYDGLHVIDGSTLSANLGVNPSLSITAQAERATALWPNKGETDQRPLVGAPYRRIDPIAPEAPVVPGPRPGRAAQHPARNAANPSRLTRNLATARSLGQVDARPASARVPRGAPMSPQSHRPSVRALATVARRRPRRR